MNSKNRVQAIKDKFENLTHVNDVKINEKQLNKHGIELSNKENDVNNVFTGKQEQKSSNSDEKISNRPDVSNIKEFDGKKTLSRQSSDPGKKLQRSHAFRIDRNQVISPKRHGSCHGRSETKNFTLKSVSKEKLTKLTNVLENQMKKDTYNSIPDSEVPAHILEQYAKVFKPKKVSQEPTDSGVSSETENFDDERSKKSLDDPITEAATLKLEENVTNLQKNKEIASSTDTMCLERKNPHLKLTDTLKKALKQPLPAGPPPKKPPRIFTANESRKDAKHMLEKLEQVLEERERRISEKNIYDIAETDLTETSNTSEIPKKEIHYLCTEILDITQKTLLPNTKLNCFNNLNCTVAKSTTSLPYTRLSRNSFCSCSQDNLNERPRLSTFKEDVCSRCKLNQSNDSYKCHINCHCKVRRSMFYDKEPIYDVPFGGKKSDYGVVNGSLKVSRSVEDLKRHVEEEKIYDVPCDISRTPTPEPQEKKETQLTEFEKLRLNFEQAESTKTLKKTNDELPETRKLGLNSEQNQRGLLKKMESEELPETRKLGLKFEQTQRGPLVKMASEPKFRISKSTENVSEGFKNAKLNLESKFSTDSRKYQKNANFPKKGRKEQIDTDKENLNRLMSEIYETVTVACKMDDRKPTKFPTDGDSTSEESIKLTRSLTEKRKNYVRTVSRKQTSVCTYRPEHLEDKENQYSTFRSWKSFKTSQSNINKMAVSKMADGLKMAANKMAVDKMADSSKMADVIDSSDVDNLSIDDKAGCLDLTLPFARRAKGLFDLCILVGLNHMTGQAYVKSVFPNQVQVPPHIESLVFPETISVENDNVKDYDLTAEKMQCYSLVLTDERGERNYGYCRRVLPEGATYCLPLCYCIIGRYRAPGLYYRILKEIESRHGCSDSEMNSILSKLFESDFPNPGEEINLTYKTEIHQELTSLNPTLMNTDSTNLNPLLTNLNTNSTLNPESLNANLKSKTLPYKIEKNNNRPESMIFSTNFEKKISIKRPIEPRVDENCMAVLLDTMGAGLLIKIFGSLLLERKVVIMGDTLSKVSSCIEGLQSCLYPLVWPHPLISSIPAKLRVDMLEAPLPMLAGLLKRPQDCWPDDELLFEEGMLIDITQHPPKLLFYNGDESTILPVLNYKTLKTTLNMETLRHSQKTDDKTRNVLISEAFVRFFVDIFKDFWTYFAVGEMGEQGYGNGDVVFDKDLFVKNSKTKQLQLFLEWFTESAMFRHFIQNAAILYENSKELGLQEHSTIQGLVDVPLPNYYELFIERVRIEYKPQNLDCPKQINYKSVVNKKVKLLRNKLRDLVP